ncbi:MAG: signal peptidase II [Bryobacteraceae bacterium]
MPARWWSLLSRNSRTTDSRGAAKSAGFFFPLLPRRAACALIAAAVLLTDRVTKLWIERNVSVWDTLHVIPGFFDIVHAKNKGAAFGIFSEGESQLRTFLLIGISLGVLIFISVMLLRPSPKGFGETRLSFTGLSLVLGGALGNVYDRIVHGMVTDFLEFYIGAYRFAAFNIADSAITVGAAMLLLDMWRTRNQAVET